MTGLDMNGFVRMILQESAAGEWTADDIQRALNYSLRKYSGKVYGSASEFYLSSASGTLSSGTPS